MTAPKRCGKGQWHLQVGGPLKPLVERKAGKCCGVLRCMLHGKRHHRQAIVTCNLMPLCWGRSKGTTCNHPLGLQWLDSKVQHCEACLKM